MSSNLGLNFLKSLYKTSQFLGALPPLNFQNFNNNNNKSNLCCMYSIFLILFYASLYGISLGKRFKDTYPFTPNITDTFLDFASYTTMTITSLIFIYNNCFKYHQEIQIFFKKFIKNDNNLLKHDFLYKTINNPHKKWFKIHLFVLGILLCFNCFYSEIFWSVTINYEVNWGYTGAVLLKINLFVFAMVVYNILLALKERFVYLNKLLENCELFKVDYVKDVYVIHKRRRFDVGLMNRVHKELLMMCADCNKIFGTPLLFLSLSFVVSILHPINSALLQVMKGNIFDGVDVPNFGLHYVIMSVLSAFNSVILVVPIAHAAYSVVNESTLAIQLSENLAQKLTVFEYDHKVEAIIGSLRSWTREMIHKYPIFTACTFYKVDHSMLLTIFGSVSSYLIVLIQINMIETNITNTTSTTNSSDIK